MTTDAWPPHWPAIAAARRGDRGARVPLWLGAEHVGSVARAQLGVLQRLAGPGWRIADDGVLREAAGAEAAFAALNQRLREAGAIVAWRDEPYPLFGAGGAVRCRIERASARFWGTLTRGAHANGWVAGGDGRPCALWIAQRAWTKATDPGQQDNLIGGGVPAGQSPWQTLQREGWEEAGLDAALLATALPGRVIALEREIPEGWQREHLHVFDLQLPQGVVPANQDGEVLGFRCLPLAEAVALAGSGAMTVDAALAMLDFVLRHRLLAPAALAALDAAAAPLWADVRNP